jgi:hypothetical protein
LFAVVQIRAVPRAVKAGILLFDSVSDASSAVAAFLHADLPSLARYSSPALMIVMNRPQN